LWNKRREKEVKNMPGGDGTGPMGFGPGTGRFAGYCGGYPMPGYANFVPGRRAWRRFGYSRPWFNNGPGYRGAFAPGQVYPAAVTVDEKGYLEQQAEYLREQLKMVEEELKNIKPKEGE
jgi:hypothetical protein